MNNPYSQIPLFLGLILAFAFQAHAIQDDEFDSPEQNVKFNVYFKLEANSRKGKLFIEASIRDGWSTFSTTQPAGGPNATKFQILDSDEFAITGAFEPNEDPHINHDDAFDLLIEKYSEKVTWSAPVEFADGVTPKDLEIEFKADGQACDMETGICVHVNELLTAAYNGELQPLNLQTTYEPQRAHVIWTGTTSASAAAAGDTIEVTLTAEPTGGFKIYGFESESQGTVAQPTRIALSKTYGWEVSEVTASPEPNTKEVDGELQKYYKDEVSWTMNLRVPSDAKAGTYRFEGYVAYQNCTDAMCDPPGAAKFAFDIQIGGENEAKPQKVGFMKGGRYGSVAALADRKTKEKAELEK